MSTQGRRSARRAVPAAAQASGAAATGLWPPLGGRTHLLALLALGTLAALVYANSFQAGFTLDNAFRIHGDARVHQASADNVRQIFTQDYSAPRFVNGVYRPLTTLSLMFNYAVLGGGENPAGYHVLNLLLHWVNAVLVYCLALAVLADAWAAFFTAALFTTHPIATEAVTNIIGRADLLATLAVLGGTLLYLRSGQESGRRRTAWLLGLALGTTLGLLAKESAVGILGAMLAFDLAYRVRWRSPGGVAELRRQLWALFRTGYIALVPAFAAVALLRASVYRNLEIGEVPFLENPLVQADALSARLTALKVLGRYVWHLLWPAALSCDYSYDAIPLVAWPPTRWEDWQGFLALAGLVAALVALVRWRRRSPAFVFFALFFLLTFLPTSNLPLIIGTIMGDRLVYLPSVGFAGCLVVAVAALCHRRLATVLLGLIVVAYGVRTLARNADWRDDLRLFESAARAAPGSYKVHKALAWSLDAQDRDHAQLDRIIEEEERALAIIATSSLPPGARSWSLLQSLGEHHALKAALLGAETAEGRRRLARAADLLTEAAAVNQAKEEIGRAKALGRDTRNGDVVRPGAPEIYAALGRVHLTLGDIEKAGDAFDHLAHLVPAQPDAHVGLARVQIARGEVEQAAVSLLAALTVDRRRQDAWQLLVQVYERTDPGGCAILREAGRAAVNWNCPLVRTQLCTADAQLIRLFLAARQRPAAQQLAEQAVRQLQCPRETIEPLLAGG